MTSTLIPDALRNRTALLLVLSKPRQPQAPQGNRISIRPLELRGQPHYQFTRHFSDRTTHTNFSPAEAAVEADRLFAESFAHATLYTPEADLQIRSRRDGQVHVTRRPATHQPAGVQQHNRDKQYLIPENVPCAFLEAIGVMTPTGQVRKSMYHKFRQINRFLELVNDIVPELPERDVLRVVDFGCGKSYLTFAVHHLLTRIHNRSVQIVGLDRKTDVLQHCTELASRLECQGLEFQTGDIAGHVTSTPVDLAVSLHACDTATDHALAKGVEWGCAVILAVPCCQHELAPQLQNESLTPLLKHGLLRERVAALATDALRAQLLELAGYSTQLVEFIDLEHTPKNILIRSVRRPLAADRREKLQREYVEFVQTLGIGPPTLEGLLSSRQVNPLTLYSPVDN